MPPDRATDLATTEKVQDLYTENRKLLLKESSNRWKGIPCLWIRRLMSVKMLCVTQLRLTLCNPTDYSPPGSSDCGISQARILEWVAVSFSGDLPDPQIKPTSPALAGRFFNTELPGKPIKMASLPKWVYRSLSKFQLVFFFFFFSEIASLIQKFICKCRGSRLGKPIEKKSRFVVA